MLFGNGLNRIRDLHNSDMSYAWMGTSGTAVIESQTGLQAGTAVSIFPIVKTQADRTNTIVYTLPSTAGTAVTYREFSVFAMAGSAGTAYDRSVFTGIIHTAYDDVVVTKSYYYRNL